jgi:hypothetical protein
MREKRYAIVLAIKTNENELVPIWDDRVVFDEEERYGNTILLKDNRFTSYSPIECLYDLKTKRIVPGIEVNYYPSEDGMKFNKGEIIYFETEDKSLAEAVIDEIVYELYDLEVKRGEDISFYRQGKYGISDLDIHSIYSIKHWSPIYVLNNGKRIKWEHQLYKKHVEKHEYKPNEQTR